MRENVINIIVEASSDSKLKFLFNFPTSKIVKFGLLKSLELFKYMIYIFNKISIILQYSFNYSKFLD
jgi:hypothetical protein